MDIALYNYFTLGIKQFFLLQNLKFYQYFEDLKLQNIGPLDSNFGNADFQTVIMDKVSTTRVV